jgi:hypothetical protein
MTGYGMLGLMLAFIVEAANWTNLRWDFNDAACIRAWHITVAATALSMVFIWVDGNPYLMVPRLLGWLPALLLPLQFVQAFGLRNSIPGRTFSFFTNKQRELNHRHGLDYSAVNFNFGHVYLIMVMVAATPLGDRPDSWLFLPGLVVLTVWALLGCGRCRRVYSIVLLLLAGGIGVAGQIGLAKTYDWLNYGVWEGTGDFLNPNHYRTAIGRLGEIKQSTSILWRVRPDPANPVPTHLRGVCYNRYRAGLWNNLTPPETTATDSDFKPLAVISSGNQAPVQLLRAKTGQSASPAPGLPRFMLRGAATANAPLPLPGNAASLRDFQVDAIECNSLGTVRVFPQEPIINGSVTWGDHANPETPPWPEVDLDVQTGERAALRQVLTNLQLAEHATLSAKLAVLSRFFRDFQYTRYNTIRPPPIGITNGPSAISVFLTTSRRGHCEYFATAACLLLREAGIPTRYAIGYAVMEHDAKRREYVIRGLHGHAWTRVWDADTKLWIDFDPTPPGWLDAESRHGASLQWLLDEVQRLREDFALWRGRARNRMVLTTIMFGIGSLGMVFIFRRLWYSKRTLQPVSSRRQAAARGCLTPLHNLEKPAAKHLPPRLPGQPFCQWLGGLRPYLACPAALAEAIRLHQQLRFDPAPPPAPATSRLADLTKELERALRLRRKTRPGLRSVGDDEDPEVPCL